MQPSTKRTIGHVSFWAGVISLLISFLKPKKGEILFFVIGAVLIVNGVGFFISAGFKDDEPSTDTSTNSNAQQRTKSDCCKDADGRSCYPCVSVACCGAGFRAGYVENRDIMARNKPA